MPNAPQDTMVSITKDRYKVGRVGASVAINDEVLANASMDYHRDEIAQRTIAELTARVLEGPEKTVTLDAYFEAHTVDSVWAAVCYYWLQPLFYFLYNWTKWQWLYDLSLWASNHVTLVTDEQYRTETYVTKMCPHVKVPDQQRHVEFLRSDKPVGFYTGGRV